MTAKISILSLLFFIGGLLDQANAERVSVLQAPLLYVALGASDAVGVGASQETRGYVKRIEQELNACVVNLTCEMLGISGARIDQISTLEVPAALPLKPGLVTLWTGPNDIVAGRSPEDFESHLRRILNDLKNKTSAFIAVGNVPDMTKLPTFQRDPNPNVSAERIAAFNQAINRQAGAYGVTLVDLSRINVSANLVNDEDGFHPNDAGYKKIADAFLTVIRPRYCR